ncbi:MAG: hypothetical protein JW836_01850, partial [Deltaproteobacteria bacterium]|nr:hypothetical protein [Deltaproteobacteria bacterium]
APGSASYLLERPEGLTERMRDIKMILEDTRLSPEERLLAQDLFKTYKAFEKASLNHFDKETRDFVQSLLSNLIHLDTLYFSSLSSKKAEPALSMSSFPSKRKKIMDRYFSEDYQAVINDVAEIENTLGTDSLTPEISLVYALSLAKQGMIQDAMRVGTRISDDLQMTPGVIELRAKMVEWQLSVGDKKGAVHSYEKLVDSLHEKEAFLMTAEKNIYGRSRTKAFVKDKEEPPLPTDLAKEPPSLQQVLQQVDALVKRNDFDGAKLILLRHAIRLQEGPEADRVDQAMKSVELAEEKFREQEQSDVFQKRETLELAAGLIEQEKYEEAIMQIESVMWGEVLGLEAKQLENLAVEKIIKRERNEAAKLFLMAKNSRDHSKKEGYLIASRNILKTLLEKYPSTPLYQTINNNLEKIDEELSKVKKSS